MAQLSDLIQDSKLETKFLPGETVHTYHEPDPTSGQRLVSRSEHWQRQREIGGGGFGTVWLEKCTKGGNRDIEVRAIKEIKIARQINYYRELEAIAKFSHRKVWFHQLIPLIVRFVDTMKYERCFVKSFGWYEGPERPRPEHLFIAMEYLELGDLKMYLNKNPALPEHEAREITFQILDGLSLMHGNRFTHRDLKPNNILLKSCPPDEWWVKIADFGISKRIKEGFGRSTVVGTPGYMAPELHGFIEQGCPYAADIWAVGEIAFQMLTKQQTFKNHGLLSVYVNKPETFPSNELLSHVSQPGVEFILSAMHPIPANRITAEKALHHRWKDHSLPYHRSSVTPVDNNSYIASAIDSMTADEGYATWTTKTPITVIPWKAQALSTKPLRTFSHETKFYPLQSTASSRPDGKLVTLLKGHSGRVWAVTFSPDGKLVASASGDETVKLWDSATGVLLSTLKGHCSWVYAVKFSPDGKLVASSSVDSTVRLWDPATGAAHGTMMSCSSTEMAFSPDGKLGASLFNGSTVGLWDPATGAEHSMLKGHSNGIRAITFSPDGKLLASASYDKTIMLWDPATGVARSTLKGHSHGVKAITFSPDGKLVASASEDKTIRLWDPATGAARSTLKGHLESIEAIAFSPDGKLVASTSRDKTVRLWDTTSGAECSTLRGHDGVVCAIAFSPDGNLVASSSYDGTVRLWDPANGAPRRTLKGHSNAIYDIAFSPTSKLLASASNDHTVRLWEY